ncbi:MAG: hypothetical protein ACRC6L_12965 [Steroidobacteraceae bacterium]
MSSARARKLRRLGERVWWDRQWEVLVWDIGASKRQRQLPKSWPQWPQIETTLGWSRPCR